MSGRCEKAPAGRRGPPVFVNYLVIKQRVRCLFGWLRCGSGLPVLGWLLGVAEVVPEGVVVDVPVPLLRLPKDREMSGTLGLSTLRLMKIEIDCRDGLVNFSNDSSIIH
jgi:hypothetical protein